MSTHKKATLVMGPVLFNWQPEKWRDFYFRIADEADVDQVCVGEVVCSKRESFFAPYMEEVFARLGASGKRVILSTLALVMTKREMNTMRDIVSNSEANIIIEANDVSAIALLNGQPHAVGPFVNVYNEGTLAYLAARGAQSVCLPVELGMNEISALAKNTPTQLEALVFGRLPLAISARCYHARAHDLHKDGCQFVCDKDPNGMDVETIDGKPFLAVNGVQTMSHAYADFSSAVPNLLAAGVSRLRLSPHSNIDMVGVAEIFRNVSSGSISTDEASANLASMFNGGAFCNGYINNQVGCSYL